LRLLRIFIFRKTPFYFQFFASFISAASLLFFFDTYRLFLFFLIKSLSVLTYTVFALNKPKG